MPSMLQFVQSPNASGLYSTRVLLAGMNCAAGDVACAVSDASGLYSTRIFLTGTNCAAEAGACAVSDASGLYSTLVLLTGTKRLDSRYSKFNSSATYSYSKIFRRRLPEGTCAEVQVLVKSERDG